MPWAAAFDVAPGASKVFTWDAEVDQSAYRGGRANAYFEFKAEAGDADDKDNAGRIVLEVPGGKGTLRVKAFVDAKGDYEQTQQALTGVEVVVTQPSPGGARVASGMTDAQGYVLFAGLAPQDYFMGVTGRRLRDADGPKETTRVQVQANVTLSVFLPVLPVGGPSSSPSASPAGSPGGGATTLPSTTPASPEPPTSPSAVGSPSASVSSAGTVSPSPTANNGGLALTGSSSGPLAGVGVGVIAIGAAAVFVVRRRRQFVAE